MFACPGQVKNSARQVDSSDTCPKERLNYLVISTPGRRPLEMGSKTMSQLSQVDSRSQPFCSHCYIFLHHMQPDSRGLHTRLKIHTMFEIFRAGAGVKTLS